MKLTEEVTQLAEAIEMAVMGQPKMVEEGMWMVILSKVEMAG